MPCPGGVPWVGDAAKAAQQRADADRLTVDRLAGQLTAASGMARAGADKIEDVKHATLAKVSAAEGAGFMVGEDFSVTSRDLGDPATIAARQAQAQYFAAEIRSSVAELMQTEKEVAASVRAAAAGIGDVAFDEPQAGDETGTVRAVDYREVPQDLPNEPGSVDQQGPSADDIRAVLEQLPQGSRPNIREVQSEEALENLWRWIGQGGVEGRNRYGNPAIGVWRDLPDGTSVGKRYESRSTQNPSLDISLQGGEPWKVHINTESGGVPKVLVEGSAAAGSQAPVDGGWGTQVSPDEARNSGGVIGILQDFVDAVRPPDRDDPKNTA